MDWLEDIMKLSMAVKTRLLNSSTLTSKRQQICYNCCHTKIDKLLLFDVRDGWEPLCKFLDLQKSDIPFQNLNDKDLVGLHNLRSKRHRVGGSEVGWDYSQIRSCIIFLGNGQLIKVNCTNEHKFVIITS